MDAELDLVEDANDLIAVHNAVEDAEVDEPGDFDDSDEEEELEDEENEEETGGPPTFTPLSQPSSQRIRPEPLQLLQEPGEEDSVASPLPPHLKEISSLAAWTVSSHKTGCGVAALCDPSTASYWQSDGPQPHYLNIHFFKMVSVAYIRVFLDFQQDESYTPTKLHFLAGTGHHDLQDVCTMSFKEPKGWLEVDLSNAGGPNPFEDGDLDDDEPESKKGKKRSRLPGHGPTLRCRIVQLRILENHQNGKDTHLRGLQLFAIDESAVRVRRRRGASMEMSENQQKSPKKRVASAALSEAADAMQDVLPSGSGLSPGIAGTTGPAAAQKPTSANHGRKLVRPGRKKSKTVVGLREPDWMGEPTLR